MAKRSLTKNRILNYCLSHTSTSRVELSRELDISMPTVLSAVNEFMEEGLLKEVGTLESTGGRRTKSIGINGDYCHALGIVITANHLEMVLINIAYEIECTKRLRLPFAQDAAYCANGRGGECLSL